MMEFLTSVLNSINSSFLTPVLVVTLVGTGIFLTIRLRFVQIKQFKRAFKKTFGGFSLAGKKADNKGMSSFQSLATAVSSQMGTGNLVGTAAALMLGGPGGLFWMWVSSFLGMATIYTEVVLAQKYKVVKDGVTLGGPAYYIREAFKGKLGVFLATWFSLAIILLFGLVMMLFQANAIATSMVNVLPAAFLADNQRLAMIVSGLLLAVFCAFIFAGGTKRIASFAEKVMPILAVTYLIAALVIIFMNITNLPNVIVGVFIGAFNPQAVLGGGLGIGIVQAIRWGFMRGMLANEAGTGSAPHAHAVARVNHPCEQGMVAMIGVFSVFLVVTLTGLAILSSGVLQTMVYILSDTSHIPNQLAGSGLIQLIFNRHFSYFGNIFIAVAMFFFGFTTMIAIYFYGAQNVRMVFGNKGIFIFAATAIMATFIGANVKIDIIWALIDFFIVPAAVINVAAVLKLSGEVSGAIKEFNGLSNVVNR
ncbi:MAG: amino acid carrier protein [Spirochaetaceae bacterium]|nr:amino acid carrier protein [Spirochaetaceae bacterium]